jgi:voltage-gated potassium channel
LRVFRLVRVFRLLRQYGIKQIGRGVLRDRAESALLTLLLFGFLVLEFGTLGILRLEQYAPGANITTASDALWYVIVTISTVGYGDRYPVTTNGPIVGTLIIIVGVGIFGTFTGYLANLFLTPTKMPSSAEAHSPSDEAQTKVNHLKTPYGRAASIHRRDRSTPSSRPLTSCRPELASPSAGLGYYCGCRILDTHLDTAGRWRSGC